MESIADRIYGFHERRWSEAEPELIPPPTRRALVQDSATQVVTHEHTPQIPVDGSTTSHHLFPSDPFQGHRRGVIGTSGIPFGDILEEEPPEGRQAVGNEDQDVEKKTRRRKSLVPRPSTWHAAIPTVGLERAGPRSSEERRGTKSSISTTSTVPDQPNAVTMAKQQQQRKSSIIGTKDWSAHSIHYRVNTRNYMGSISGASAFTGEVEIDENELSGEPVAVPAPRPVITSFHVRTQGKYEINRIAAHDDADLLSPFKRRLFRFAPLFTLLAMSSYLGYFGYRIYCTVSAQTEYHRTYVMAWLFIASEFCVAIPAFFHNTYALLAAKGRKRPKLRLEHLFAPTVDVFVTCCKEDVDVVIDTTRAACAVDYPQDRFRVVVCDDGADLDLREAVEALTLEYPNLYYHARIKEKGKPHHFKAGNLIAATEMVELLPGGGGEYIAALDADMIAEADWLRCIIAHLIDNPRLALACPPQLFYNIPDNDPLVQSLDAFVHVMEPTKDANGVAWCTGSGYAIRREALNDIGGWPTGSLAEDVFTSSKLLGAGWDTAFIHEPLQFGTVPDTYTGHLKQRTRWTLGTLQTALKLNFCLYGPTIQKMSLPQRLSGFVFTIDAFFKIFLQIALLTIPIVLLSGGTLVAFATYGQLRWQIRLAFINLVLIRLQEFVAFLPSGYRLAQRDSGAQMWMAPYHSLTILRSFLLPRWLGGKPMAFSSSGSIKSELNERDASTRAPLARRVLAMLWDCSCYMHLAYVALVLVAVSLSFSRAFRFPDAHRTLLYLLTHAFWPPVLWLLCLTAYCVPLLYTIWPPTMPTREELIDRDEKTQIARPKQAWKQQRWGKWTFWHEFQYTACTIYTTVIFIGSFVY